MIQFLQIIVQTASNVNPITIVILCNLLFSLYNSCIHFRVVYLIAHFLKLPLRAKQFIIAKFTYFIILFVLPKALTKVAQFLLIIILHIIKFKFLFLIITIHIAQFIG